MTPSPADPQVTVLHGDSCQVLTGLAADSMDVVLTDPPYRHAVRCTTCSAAIELKPRARRDGNHYCSARCRNTARNMSLLTGRCPGCSQAIVTGSSACHRCTQAAKRTKPTLTCPSCRREFVGRGDNCAKPSVYCSKPCGAAGKSKAATYDADWLGSRTGLADEEWDARIAGLDPGFCYWLTGLIDGEDCFRIQKAHGSASASYSVSFTLKLRDDDGAALRMIVDTLRVGYLKEDASRTGNSKPCLVWIVTAQQAARQLAGLLGRYPLRSKKARDAEVWCRAAEWLVARRQSGAPADWSYMATAHRQLQDVRRYQGRR